ncbi:hypothetical protein AHAS_Ahas03G0207500 [Arachis hypogaea]
MLFCFCMLTQMEVLDLTSLADSYFPVNDGPAASRLHEFFLHQFCDAHSCIGSKKPFSRDRQRDEKGNSTVEAHLSNWQKEKTILMDRFVVFGSSCFSNTFRIHRSLLICDSGYCTLNSAIGECSWRRRARKTAKSAPRFLHVCCKPISLRRLSKHKFELQD